MLIWAMRWESSSIGRIPTLCEAWTGWSTDTIWHRASKEFHRGFAEGLGEIDDRPSDPTLP